MHTVLTYVCTRTLTYVCTCANVRTYVLYICFFSMQSSEEMAQQLSIKLDDSLFQLVRAVGMFCSIH